MPKDPTKNIANYKVDGGELNEYEFQQNQEELAEQHHRDLENIIPGTAPEEHVPQVIEEVKLVVEERAEAAAKKSSRKASKASGKKKAAKKAEKKVAAKSTKKASRKS